MRIEYNGVSMELVELHGYHRANVYGADACDLLYVRHHLNMTVGVAPGGRPAGMATDHLTPLQAQAQAAHPDPRNSGLRGRQQVPDQFIQHNGAGLVASNGMMAGFAGVTDRALYPVLMRPRQKLRVIGYRPTVPGNPGGNAQLGDLGNAARAEPQAEEFTWLESPREGMSVDSANGPHPLSCTVAEPTGDGPNSLLLNFQIETHLPLAEQDASRVIVSHRWTSAIGHDDDYYQTRQVSGEVVFDTALLALYGAVPYDFLSQLYHPIPLGYQRGLPLVQAESDGAKLTYAFTDTQVPCVFDAGETGATRCWIEEEWKYVSPRGIGAVDAAGALEGIGRGGSRLFNGRGVFGNVLDMERGR